MSKPTPGPWKAFTRTKDDWALDDVMTAVEPRKRICNVYGGTYEAESEYAANARLIAAAPDLLSACKLYLAHATTTSGVDSLLTDDERQRMEEVHRGYTKPIIIERMQAAIAKAECQ